MTNSKPVSHALTAIHFGEVFDEQKDRRL